MNLYYRDQHGDLTRIGFVQSRDNGDVYSYINKEYDGIDEISETIGEKARGAYRKWG
jgi:hypothetical protein